MRYFSVAALFLLLLAGSLVFGHDKFQVVQTWPSANQPITLLFVGDIMLDRGVEFYITQHNDWKLPFLKIAEVLKEADLVFGNLESVISDKGQNLGSIYSFRADPKAIEGLVFAGFDVLSVANNHSLDYGAEALWDSVLRLKQAGIDLVGLQLKSTIVDFNQRVLVKEIRKGAQDVKIGILAYTALGSPLDVVVGHHPHMAQHIEQYRQGWIAYSLGNFVFDQGFSPETMEGLLLEVKIEGKQITQVFPRVIRMNSSFQPEL